MNRLTKWLRSRTRLRRIFDRTTPSARADLVAAISTLDLEPIRQRYAGSPRLKYLDIEWHVGRNFDICHRLGLIGAPPKRVLDIGCGAGMLLYCMQRYGHEAIGIDIADDFYAEMAQLYSVDRRIEAVRPFRPLHVEGAFDLVTAIATVFDRTPNGVWRAPEWHYFLSDLESRLTEHGCVFILLNRTPHAGRPLDAFAAGSERGGRSRLLFDRAGLARTIAALERETGRLMSTMPAPAYDSPRTM